MKFYDVNGTEISKEQFVTIYGDSYFIGNERIVNRVVQNSRYIEEKIEQILCDGIKTPIDVVHILAWKIGKLKHYECENENKFVYHKDWKNAENMDVKIRNKKFDIRVFSDYIAENIDCIESLYKKNPQSALNKLNEGSVEGIGPVYLITMLYFITKRECPIYDRFAMKAIEAIVNDAKPGSDIKEKQLPDKNSKKFGKIMETEMKEYIDDLKDIFGNDYKDRNVDRALWVYGHMFKKITLPQNIPLRMIK